jgi:hypothetical protein
VLALTSVHRLALIVALQEGQVRLDDPSLEPSMVAVRVARRRSAVRGATAAGGAAEVSHDVRDSLGLVGRPKVQGSQASQLFSR